MSKPIEALDIMLTASEYLPEMYAKYSYLVSRRSNLARFKRSKAYTKLIQRFSEELIVGDISKTGEAPLYTASGGLLEYPIDVTIDDFVIISLL